MASEVHWTGVLAGGLLGGLTHVLLDGMVHTDVRPVYPLSPANPFFELLSWDMVENACIVAGIIGAIWLGLRPKLFVS